jgi:acetolactate synthase-1/2/3 large subunit
MVVDDINEAIKPNLNIDMIIFAGLSTSISALIEEASPHKEKFPAEWLTWKKRCRQIANEYLPRPSHYSRSAVFINPYHAIFAIFEHLKEGDSIITGNGISVVGVFQVARLKKRQRLFQNAGCASMGYDLPASIGASVAASIDSRVVCITGDGSIQMNIQELQTISELDANIIIFVFNNNGYDSIRQSQESIFGEGAKHFGISPETGISFPSLEKVSGAYGLPYIRIKDYEDLQGNLERALLHEKVICEICVTNQQNFEPKTETKVAENGSLMSGSLTDMKPYLSKNEIEGILSKLVG